MTKYTITDIIKSLADRPKLTASELKAKFDKANTDIGNFINNTLIPEVEAALSGKSDSSHTHEKTEVGLGNVDNTPDIDKPVSNAVQSALDLKVDKADGKELSDNNYTNEEKENVSSNTAARHTHLNKDTIDGINEHKLSVWDTAAEELKLKANKDSLSAVATSGSYNDLINKPIRYVVSTDRNNPLALQGMDMGLCVLHGYFVPYQGSEEVSFYSYSLAHIKRINMTTSFLIFSVYNQGIEAILVSDDNDYTKRTVSFLELENINNKVLAIDDSSDDTQYPSAKAVYDALPIKRLDFADESGFDNLNHEELLSLSGAGCLIYKGYCGDFPYSMLVMMGQGMSSSNADVNGNETVEDDGLRTFQFVHTGHSLIDMKPTFKSRVYKHDYLSGSGFWSDWAEYLTSDDVVDNLASSESKKALSANMGAHLEDRICIVESNVGSIETALDNIIAIQNTLIGGESV